jgi:regulator of Ty1 transposition protein 103
MDSVFSEEILADKLSKLNGTQQCIESILLFLVF